MRGNLNKASDSLYKGKRSIREHQARKHSKKIINPSTSEAIDLSPDDVSEESGGIENRSLHLCGWIKAEEEERRGLRAWSSSGFRGRWF